MNKAIVASLIFIMALFSCGKDPLNYTNKMAGNHKWTGKYYPTSAGTSFFVDISYDTAIVVINDETIAIGSRYFLYCMDTLHYASSNKKKKTITFTSEYLLIRGGWDDEYKYDTLTFNYSNSSIAYSQIYINEKYSYTECVKIATP